MLTQKQRKLLDFIQKRLEKDGVSPSFEEMKGALNLRSKSGIHRMVTALEERGFIRRLANRARALEIVRFPDGSFAKPRLASFSVPIPENSPSSSAGEATTIPLVGRIAAGEPIEALNHGPQSIAVPQDVFTRDGRHYALEVKGDSMNLAGILDGDIVIIREQITAEDGDIVVALVEDNEATLKRLRYKRSSIALEAANPAYETRIYSANQIRIQGRLAGLVRSY